MVQLTVGTGRFDPYRDFNFKVRWEGRYVAGISMVSALKRATDVIEHRAGGDPGTSRNAPGRTGDGTVKLERGVTHDIEFAQWARMVPSSGSGAGAEVSPADLRKDVIVDLFDAAGRKVRSYRLYRCRVSEFQSVPDLDPNASAIAIDTLKLETEGWADADVFTEPSTRRCREPG